VTQSLHVRRLATSLWATDKACRLAVLLSGCYGAASLGLWSMTARRPRDIWIGLRAHCICIKRCKLWVYMLIPITWPWLMWWFSSVVKDTFLLCSNTKYKILLEKCIWNTFIEYFWSWSENTKYKILFSKCVSNTRYSRTGNCRFSTVENVITVLLWTS